MAILVAFDYRFQTLENGKNELGRAFGGLLFIGYVPRSIREWLGDHLPNKRLNHARYTAKLSAQTAKQLYAQKSEGRGHGKDIMSLLMKANANEDEKLRLSDEEMLGFMRVVILAGHDTTSNTFSWMCLELSRHPDVQTKLRAEIRQMQRNLESRGQTYTQLDLDSMPYLNAVLKETLRYHPAAINTFRIAGRDDVLPLSKPITTSTGEAITELPIPKGLRLIASINGYNRNKEIFGDDAHMFNPERWLNSSIKPSTSVGVVGNLWITVSPYLRRSVLYLFTDEFHTPLVCSALPLIRSHPHE
ncbi:hypothetical protein C0989_005438 [Termitomyces sp. Mn162]|nr:hypothetical protein C0989_005438 [Termitomyces sp. Mn162]